MKVLLKVALSLQVRPVLLRWVWRKGKNSPHKRTKNLKTNVRFQPVKTGPSRSQGNSVPSHTGSLQCLFFILIGICVLVIVNNPFDTMFVFLKMSSDWQNEVNICFKNRKWKLTQNKRKETQWACLESIGSDLEELRKCVMYLLLFSAGKVLEVALVEEEL